MDVTVLERQQARLKLLEHQQRINHNNSDNFVNQNYTVPIPSIETCPIPRFQCLLDHQLLASGDVVADWNKKKNPESCLGTGDLIRYGSLLVVGGDGSQLVGNSKMGLVQVQGDIAAAGSADVDHCLSRSSCSKTGVVEVAKMEEELEDAVVEGTGDVRLTEEMRPKYGGDHALLKRKAEVVEAEEQSEEKRIKGEIEVGSSSPEKSSTLVSPESSKDNQKSSGAQKQQDYIHVRARRGQATDSHSLAERARREKISKKMKYLQDLVPGCNKITGRAGMLDEIINYVQSLQRQVEFLSMKLAALNPRQEPINIDNFPLKEFPAHVASIPAVNPSTAIANLPLLNQLNVRQQQATSSEPELPINPPEILHEINTSPSMFIPELCPDSSSCFSSFWDGNPQGLHNFGFH